MSRSKLLATTWNSNEAGTLWKKSWYYGEEKGYYTYLDNGYYITNPEECYPNEDEFWKAYRKEAKQFKGRKETN